LSLSWFPCFVSLYIRKIFPMCQASCLFLRCEVFPLCHSWIQMSGLKCAVRIWIGCSSICSHCNVRGTSRRTVVQSGQWHFEPFRYATENKRGERNPHIFYSKNTGSNHLSRHTIAIPDTTYSSRFWSMVESSKYLGNSIPLCKLIVTNPNIS